MSVDFRDLALVAQDHYASGRSDEATSAALVSLALAVVSQIDENTADDAHSATKSRVYGVASELRQAGSPEWAERLERALYPEDFIEEATDE